jgi:hypothetical protein
MTLIYIGDSLLDLAPNTIVAVTVQRIDIAKIQDRFVSRTNQIALPKTANNLKTLDIVDDKTISSVVYKIQNCRVVQNGYETISNGTAIVKGIDTLIRLEIYDTDVNYFNVLKNKSVFEVVTQNGQNFGESRFDGVGLDTLRNATTNVISAYMDFGIGFNTNYFLPSFFYCNVIKAIAKVLNISDSDISTQNVFNSDIEKLIFLTAKKDLRYNERYKNIYKIVAENGSGATYAGAGTNYLNFSTVISTGSSSFHNGTNIECPSPVSGVDFLTMNVTYTVRSSVTSGSAIAGEFYEVALVRNRGGVYTEIGDDAVINIVATGVSQVDDYSFSGDIDLRGGDLIQLRVVKGGTPTVQISIGNATCEANATLNVLRGYINFDYLLQSDLMAEQFLKDWVTRLGIVFKLLPDGSLSVKKLQDILNDRTNALDWTNKRSRRVKTDFKATFAKVNYFNYKDSEENNKRGSGTIDVESALINEEAEIVKSDFSSAEDRFLTGINCAYLPVYTSSSVKYDDTINDLDLTLLSIRDRIISERAVTFNVTSRLDYKIGFFNDGLTVPNTGYPYFIDRNYSILQDSLQNNRIEKIFYNLTEKDIFEYDPFKMIFDNGEYYLVNKIENFIPGKLTSVELIRI